MDDAQTARLVGDDRGVGRLSLRACDQRGANGVKRSIRGANGVIAASALNLRSIKHKP